MFEVDLAAFAPNLFVVELLDTTQANLVRANEAEHVSGKTVIRVVALRLFTVIDAVQHQRVELSRSFEINPPNEPNEFLVCILGFANLFDQFVLALIGYRRNLARRFDNVLDFARVGKKRCRVDAAGKLSTLTIKQEAACRTCFDCPELLVLGTR